jgi:hypothetical protein
MLQLLRRMPQLMGHKACHIFSDGGRRNLAAHAEGRPRVLRSTLRPTRRRWRSGRHRTGQQPAAPHPTLHHDIISDLVIVKKTYQRGNPPHRCPCRSRQHAPLPRQCVPATAAFAPSRPQPRAACPRQEQPPSHPPKTCWARGRSAWWPAMVCCCQGRQTSPPHAFFASRKGSPTLVTARRFRAAS